MFLSSRLFPRGKSWEGTGQTTPKPGKARYAPTECGLVGGTPYPILLKSNQLST